MTEDQNKRVGEDHGLEAMPRPVPGLPPAEPAAEEAATPGGDGLPEIQLDSGWIAWSQCIAGHLVNFNTWGWVNAFGVFEAFYPEKLGRSASDVAWIGSLNIFLLFFLGTITGCLVDAGYFRIVFIGGTLLFTFAAITLSFCTTYWQFVLVQGLALGFAQGCIFCPITTVISTYFKKRRAWALGLAASGSATGGLVYPAMVRQLLPKIGFPWTMRAIGLLQIATLIAANLLARPRITPKKARLVFDWRAFKEAPYALYASGGFFSFLGVYFTVFYLADISRQAITPPFSYIESLNLLLIFNGIGILGRLVWSYLADKFHPINIYILTAACGSLLTFCFVAVRTPPGLYAWAAIYALPAAGIQSLLPASLAHLTKDVQKLGVRLGMAFTILSFAVLIGPPIAGVIIHGSGGYTGAKIFAGSAIGTGGALLYWARYIISRQAAKELREGDALVT